MGRIGEPEDLKVRHITPTHTGRRLTRRCISREPSSTSRPMRVLSPPELIFASTEVTLSCVHTLSPYFTALTTILSTDLNEKGISPMYPYQNHLCRIETYVPHPPLSFPIFVLALRC
jgi:hypothetical protein